MAWHGSSKTPAGVATLSKEQWDMLAKLAEGGGYWETSQSFMKGINGHELSSLSVKQLDWYNTVEASLDVEISRKIAREVFGNGRPHKTIKRPEQGSGSYYE